MNRARAATIALAFNCALVVFAIVKGIGKSGNPGRYFGEGRFTTLFSCVQLLLIAYFAWQTFLTRRRLATGRSIFSGPALWAFVAAGFVFLAADDAFKIHEQIDIIIHAVFHLQETPFTDRLDDALIALYGVIGSGFLWAYRRELIAFKEILPLLGAGFVSLAASVLCDTISNDEIVLRWFFQDTPVPKQLNGWFSAGDGAFTLIGEGFFAAAFYLAFRASRRSSDAA
jgi:hypothetical protein